MKANELRIGNLFWFVDEVVKVSSIKNNTSNPENGSIRINNQILWIPLDIIEPITLTEELLLMFGFEKKKSIDFGDVEFHKFISGSEYLVWYEDQSMGIGGSEMEIKKGLCFCSNSIIKNVHQLQNLYFALTGQELELKP
jgi:hypothetical protein